jgi:hypothetical protein
MKLKEIKKRREAALSLAGQDGLGPLYEAVLRDIAKHGCPMDMNKAKAALGIEKK